MIPSIRARQESSNAKAEFLEVVDSITKICVGTTEWSYRAVMKSKIESTENILIRGRLLQHVRLESSCVK